MALSSLPCPWPSAPWRSVSVPSWSPHRRRSRRRRARMRSGARHDLALLVRLAGQARPCWPHLGALLVVSLVATPLALLTPLPVKIAVDTVLGAQPLPPSLAALLPA